MARELQYSAVRPLLSYPTCLRKPRQANRPTRTRRTHRPPTSAIFKVRSHNFQRFPKSGGRQPAVGVRQTQLQHRYRTRSEALDTCGNKSGGRQPAVARETHLQRRFRKVAGDCRRCAHRRWCSRGSEPTGGLRPPLLVARTHIVGDARLRSATAFCLTRGLTPPALVLRCERLSAKKRFLRCTNAHPAKSGGREPAVDVREAYMQERFRKVAGDRRQCAHERRCSSGSEPTGGLRPPLLLHSERLPAKKTIFAMHERTSPRAAGVSPPWAWVTRLQRGPVSLGAMVVVIKSGANPPGVGIANAGAVSFVFHGWLTPAAPGCKRGRCCCGAFRIRGYVTHTTAGLRQPLLVASADVVAAVRFASAGT
jgi:hypothetical protein